MENLDWQFNLDASRHVKKRPCRNQCLVQRGELGRSQLCWLRHEMFAEQVRVLNHCPLERLENDAALFQLIRNHVALDKLVPREDHAPSYLFESARLLENSCVLLLS
jgi:hypothetical protein